MTRRRSDRRTGTLRKLLAAGAALGLGVAAVSALAFTTAPAVYLPAMAAVLLAEAAAAAVLLRRRAADYDIRSLKRVLAPRLSVEGRWPLEERNRAMAQVQAASDRAHNGFRNGPSQVLERISRDTSQSASVRSFAAEELRKLGDPRKPSTGGGTRTTERFDVVVVSNFNLPGGTTTSNANEIRLLVENGKRVGLFHHPLYSANSARPLNRKIADLVDGEAVKLIEPEAQVSCDLLIMRFPPFATRLREDLPTIESPEKILVINQAPMTYYDAIAGRKRIWDVATVHENLSSWIGEHRWAAAGPLVRQALIDHHTDDLTGVELSEDFWYPTLDLGNLKRRPSDPPRTPLRLGRHSRDHVSKWPELASDLRACYPEGPDFEIRVLGGAGSPRKVLGRLPSNWTVHQFDSIPVGDFLPELDFYVYYPSSTLLEAFGRAPVEAMASGVPTILPPVFASVFGDGAVYATPDEVAGVATALAGDPQQFAIQQKRGMEAAHERFGFEAHLGRLRSAGVDL
ncbi:hypothetical protein [Glycomyces arizonensis]|uniref:hypothetical protein n=1 Tax=Glycomyces arizonensis TaxID=256035 RepID=UPI0012ECA363|nr:hypothetical protein [Glycomyces arizonensis]